VEAGEREQVDGTDDLTTTIAAARIANRVPGWGRALPPRSTTERKMESGFFLTEAIGYRPSGADPAPRMRSGLAGDREERRSIPSQAAPCVLVTLLTGADRELSCYNPISRGLNFGRGY